MYFRYNIGDHGSVRGPVVLQVMNIRKWLSKWLKTQRFTRFHKPLEMCLWLCKAHFMCRYVGMYIHTYFLSTCRNIRCSHVCLCVWYLDSISVRYMHMQAHRNELLYVCTYMLEIRLHAREWIETKGDMCIHRHISSHANTYRQTHILICIHTYTYIFAWKA